MNILFERMDEKHQKGIKHLVAEISSENDIV